MRAAIEFLPGGPAIGCAQDARRLGHDQDVGGLCVEGMDIADIEAGADVKAPPGTAAIRRAQHGAVIARRPDEIPVEGVHTAQAGTRTSGERLPVGTMNVLEPVTFTIYFVYRKTWNKIYTNCSIQRN